MTVNSPDAGTACPPSADNSASTAVTRKRPAYCPKRVSRASPELSKSTGATRNEPDPEKATANPFTEPLRLGAGILKPNDILPLASLARFVLLIAIFDLKPDVIADALAYSRPLFRAHRVTLLGWFRMNDRVVLKRIALAASRTYPLPSRTRTHEVSVYERWMDMPSRRLAIEAFSVDFMACCRTWAEDHKLGDKEHLEFASLVFRVTLAMAAKLDGVIVPDDIFGRILQLALVPLGKSHFEEVSRRKASSPLSLEPRRRAWESVDEYEQRARAEIELFLRQQRQEPAPANITARDPLGKPLESDQPFRLFVRYQLLGEEVETIAESERLSPQNVNKHLKRVERLVEIPRRDPAQRGRPKGSTNRHSRKR
jgi:hypothetical protein